MSVGPSALGTVLVQRLDAVLGTTLGASANLVSGARPDAVTQPGTPDRPGQTDASTDPRQAVQQATDKATRQHTVLDAKTAAALALAARGMITSSNATASAPTTLGQTARTILSLLAQYPESSPAVAGKAPLWTPGQTVQTGATPLPLPSGPQNPAQNPSTPSAPAPGANAPSQGQTANATQNTAVTQASANALQSLLGSSSSAAPPAKILAQALRQALQTSGLFYESHLGDLVTGKATVAQLRNEPQAALNQNQAPNTPASTPSPSPGNASSAARSANGMPSGLETAPTGSTTVNTVPAPPLVNIPQDAALLVRQQLDVLANQMLVWQGEAWPGTPLEWEVRREQNGKENAEATSTWATRLKLELPRLGLIEARINLAGNQIVLQMAAPRSATEIKASSEQLRERLSAAGLTLSNINVSVVPPRAEMPVHLL